jgi:effector-binding domain-containing protein
MMLFMSMDNMIGKDFERGLDLLKIQVEKEATEVLKYKIQSASFAARDYAVIRQQVKFEAIKDFYMKSFEKIVKAVSAKKARIAGAPAGLYFAYDEQKMITDMAAAMPVKGKVDTEEVKMNRIPEGIAYIIDYYGPYDQSVNAYRAMDLYLAQNGLKQRVPIIEEYITDPSTEPDPDKWLTKIYFFAEN